MIDKEHFIRRLCDEFNIENHHIVSIFLYGSRVYGNNNTDASDYDFIIVKEQSEYKIDNLTSKDGIINCTTYSPKGFQIAIEEHEISILECIFLPDDMILINRKEWVFNLNLSTLRNSISQKSSNSWVKAKKKIIDKEYYIARKSLYHSLRIIAFGKQIAVYGKIVNFEEVNFMWEEIILLECDWSIWSEKYHKYRNSILTDFRKLAPKL